MFSVVLSACIFPFVGRLCDSVDSRKIVPVAFASRGILTYFFHYLEKPDSIYAYTICVAIVVSAIFENISNDSIFFKLLPKESRGLLTGVYSITGQLGILFYSLAGGYLFDNKGPTAPFVLLGIIDMSFVLVFSVFVCYEKRNRTTESSK